MAQIDEFNLVTKYLGSISLLRKFSKEKDIDFLEKTVENLLIIIEEQKEAMENERAEMERLESQRKEILMQLEEKGWTLDQLINPITLNNKKDRVKRVVKNKYAFLTATGETQYWTGRGRMPVELKGLIEAGNSLEDFLIEK